MSRISKLLSASLLLLLFCLILSRFTPERRVTRYVEAHQSELQAAMDAYFDQGQPLAYDGDIPAVNDWPGKHPMVEYLLFAGAGYYGFYYSPDDVPLAFQNAPVPLEETGGGWQWQGEGDDHGSTRRLSPRWYTFEAHF